jgi:hypothetical protein
MGALRSFEAPAGAGATGFSVSVALSEQGTSGLVRRVALVRGRGEVQALSMTSRNWVLLLGLWLALGACKKNQRQAAQAAGHDAAVSTALPVAGVPPTCRGGAELRAWLAGAWAIKPEQQVDVATCAGGMFPEPGFAITAWITPNRTVHNAPELFDYRLQILDVSGAVLADLSDPDADDSRGWLYRSLPRAQVADIDGDGAAELITTEDQSNERSQWSSLTVYERTGRTLVDAGSIITQQRGSVLDTFPALSDPNDPDDPHVVDCAAEVSMDPATPGITLEWTTKEGAEARGTCATGTQVYVLRAGKVVLE